MHHVHGQALARVAALVLVAALTLVAVLGLLAPPASGQCGDIPEAFQGECVVTFDRRYEYNYRPGEPYDYVTIRPDGGGETFADMGIRIRVRLFCAKGGPGTPVRGLPASEVVLYARDLYLCHGAYADRPTDDEGWTEFTGSMPGGGCGQGLDLFAAGVFICTVPVNVNSTDFAGDISPGATDASDLAMMATILGNPSSYSICFDYNESGPPLIDSSDLAYFAAALDSSCQ